MPTEGNPENPTPTPPPAEAKNTDIGDQGQGQGNGQGLTKGQDGGEHMVPKSRLDEVLKELRDMKKAESDREAASAKAEEDRLAEQQKFRELADSRQAKLDEVTPKAARLEKLAEILTAQVDAEIKDWPDEVKALDPGPDADIETRMEWVSKARSVIAKINAAPAPSGNGPTPRPTKPGSADDQAARKQFEQDARNFFR